MVKILSNAVTWVIVLLLAIIALLLGVLFEWWGPGEASPSTTPTPSASPGPSASPDVPLAFVERPVTVGPYVPTAQPLTEAVLASAGSGWVVAIDDTTQVNMAVDPHTVTPDQKILYLISPAGVRYELANLDAIGLTEPDLVAWDDDRDLLLLEQGGATLNVFNMTTGGVTSSWTFCSGGYGHARYGEARAGNWLVRAGCDGDGVDALYTDTGVVVPSNVQPAPAFVSVFDIGDVQVRYEFEGTVSQKYIAYYPDGTSAALPWNAVAYCGYPISRGQGDTLAVSCDAPSGGMSIQQLPVDGSLPYEVVSAQQLEDYALSNGGFGLGDFGVTGYWSDSALRIVQFWLGDGNPRIGVLYGGMIESVGADPSYPFRRCHAVSGTSALFSGGGGLWWVNIDAGGTVVMIPPMGSGSSIQTVGTDGYMIGEDRGYTALRLP